MFLSTQKVTSSDNLDEALLRLVAFRILTNDKENSIINILAVTISFSEAL